MKSILDSAIVIALISVFLYICGVANYHGFLTALGLDWTLMDISVTRGTHIGFSILKIYGGRVLAFFFLAACLVVAISVLNGRWRDALLSYLDSAVNKVLQCVQEFSRNRPATTCIILIGIALAALNFQIQFYTNKGKEYADFILKITQTAK